MCKAVDQDCCAASSLICVMYFFVMAILLHIDCAQLAMNVLCGLEVADLLHMHVYKGHCWHQPSDRSRISASISHGAYGE